jgi:hypothetical protein
MIYVNININEFPKVSSIHKPKFDEFNPIKRTRIEIDKR